MILPKSSKETSSSSPETPDENEQDHTGGSSFEIRRDAQDTKSADRIAELERALIQVKEEQNALREELDKVRHNGVTYQETVEGYRRQLSEGYGHISREGSPHRSPNRMDYEPDASPRRSFNRQREDLTEQHYELRGKIMELQEQMMEQDALYRARYDQELSRSEADWNDLTGRLHQSEKEAQERLQQLLDLKHSISALTRMESQVTDSELAERMDSLYHRIREWTVSNFRRTKLGEISFKRMKFRLH